MYTHVHHHVYGMCMACAHTQVLYSFHFYLVLTGDESGSICVWDVRTGGQVFRFEHGARLTAMELDHTGRKLLTGGADGSVCLWNFCERPLITS